MFNSARDILFWFATSWAQSGYYVRYVSLQERTTLTCVLFFFRFFGVVVFQHRTRQVHICIAICELMWGHVIKERGIIGVFVFDFFFRFSFILLLGWL